MKSVFRCLVLFILFGVLFLTSCQDEVSDIETLDEQETIVPNSSLANLMSNVATNNGAVDDFLDNASCFSLELPITVMVSDVTIVIESEADLEELEYLFNDVSVNDDILDFVFPLTIIFSDYNEFVIENEDQLQTFINECVEDDNDIIECADFVYPISFSVFNSDFNLVETVVIDNDQALYLFLDALENDENVLIVSLNFPVTLEYNNGDTIEVTSNNELAIAIEGAEQFCEDITINCVEDDILLGLIECPWDFTDGTDNYDSYQLIFNSNGSLEISEGMATSAIGGYWELSLTDDGIVLTISQLTAFQDSLEGEWLVVSCNIDDYSVNELTLLQGNLELYLEQDCSDSVFNCFGNFEIVECNQPNNTPVYNLSANTIGLVDCTEFYYPSFHETLIDAETNTNAISNTESYATLASEVYLRIESENGNYQVFVIFLNTVDCNYFECFQSFDAVLETCYTDATVLYEFNLEIAFANCTPSADYVSYYVTQSDAETGVNPISTPWEYTTAELNSTVYVQVVINDVYEIFPIQLNVINCNAGSCTESDIDGILTECIWNVTYYNGSDNLSDYNFHFEENTGVVVIYNDSTTIDATWSTSQPNDGVIIEFSNVAGPNIQAINGSWLVVECTAEQLVLHNVNDSSNEIVLDRTCN
ncbi:hypothetical protein [Winogradskyella endarachnes]|uniref:Uncharacterized protein n=1 Tax=Winogradskyella endarachnes TaxID=2681965 RepID=A0A6L6UBX1_9FLAO|nr:hypothetical protein [Winogradskyella endarachnes]MUU79479.1 hypothetical protein [Winogradskyella endarachnes]